jgi:hypothetical protein
MDAHTLREIIAQFRANSAAADKKVEKFRTNRRFGKAMNYWLGVRNSYQIAADHLESRFDERAKPEVLAV